MVTRIGIGSLVRARAGSVALPEEVTLHCPQCGTECSDKGQCLVELCPVPHDRPGANGAYTVKFLVDCRNCGCSNREPSFNDNIPLQEPWEQPA